jgi:uncharacterized protein (TIGR00255 family)
MIKSMTAFGNAEMIFEGCLISIEIRSYNSRYLDLSLNMPYEIRKFEEKIRQLLSGKVNRGRVELKLRIDEQGNDTDAFELDIRRAENYSNALAKLKEEIGLNATVSMEFLTGSGRVLKPIENEKDSDTMWQHIESCLIEALDSLNEMRQKEGDIIAKDLSTHLDDIEAAINEIEKTSENLLPVYQERLKGRIEELTKGVIEIDSDRIAQEAAFLAEKSDISEEIVRARSHIEQFRTIQRSDEPAGSKINFLLHELGREVNTIGSKTGKADVAHQVVDIKSELEKLREQIQNVE